MSACNLAVALALAGKRVVLIDADLRSPRVHAYLSLPNVVGVSSVLARRIEIDDALSTVVLESQPRQNGAMVMTAKAAVGAAKSRAPSAPIIVDAPAMLPVGDTAAAARAVDGLVYVVNPDRVRRPVLQQARSQLGHLPCALLGIIEVADRKGQGQYSGYYSHSDDSGASLRRRR